MPILLPIYPRMRIWSYHQHPTRYGIHAPLLSLSSRAAMFSKLLQSSVACNDRWSSDSTTKPADNVPAFSASPVASCPNDDPYLPVSIYFTIILPFAAPPHYALSLCSLHALFGAETSKSANCDLQPHERKRSRTTTRPPSPSEPHLQTSPLPPPSLPPFTMTRPLIAPIPPSPDPTLPPRPP